MMKLLLIFLAGFTVTALSNPLVGNVPENVSHGALKLLIGNNKTIALTGDARENETLADILTDYVLGLSVKLEVVHTCKTLSSELMTCQLSAIGRRSEEFIDYKVKVSVEDKNVEILSLYENFVTISRSGP